MIKKVKKEINKILVKRLENLKKKNLVIPEHKLIKAIGIYVLCFIISNISPLVGGLSFVGLGLLYTKNNIAY